MTTNAAKTDINTALFMAGPPWKDLASYFTINCLNPFPNSNWKMVPFRVGHFTKRASAKELPTDCSSLSPRSHQGSHVSHREHVIRLSVASPAAWPEGCGPADVTRRDDSIPQTQYSREAENHIEIDLDQVAGDLSISEVARKLTRRRDGYRRERLGRFRGPRPSRCHCW